VGLTKGERYLPLITRGNEVLTKGELMSGNYVLTKGHIEGFSVPVPITMGNDHH
jgi:hypothetical protein